MTEPARIEPEAPSGLSARARLGWALFVVLVIASIGLTIVATYRYQRVMDADRQRLTSFLARIEARLAAVPLLSAREQALLRRSLNARHLALAARLGIAPVPDRAALDTRREDLVDLSTRNPSLRAQRATYSVPFGTPDLAAALDTIAIELRRRTEAAELPPVGLVLTSGLRTTADQDALRGVNRNAARGRSSHEYGTTVDLHSERFDSAGLGGLVPPSASEALPRVLREDATATLREQAEAGVERLVERYPARYKALLGRTLIALEDDGVLVTVLERRQPVFHTTVARRMAPASP